MEFVAFIDIESGDDLILSFAMQKGEDPLDIDSLILLRTPRFELLVEDEERGVSVSLARHGEEEDDYLEAFEYVATEKIIRLKTQLHHYELDVRKIEAEDFKSMRQILRKMNFDDRFRVVGI